MWYLINFTRGSVVFFCLRRGSPWQFGVVVEKAREEVREEVLMALEVVSGALRV